MASFSILVTHAPFDKQSAYTAYQFALSVLKGGHTLHGVFFYQAGVHNANNFQRPHSDELNMFDKWQSLSADYNIDLQVCVTAANRRGIINADDAKEMDGHHFNLAPPFQEVGLGDLVELMQTSDRMVQF